MTAHGWEPIAFPIKCTPCSPLRPPPAAPEVAGPRPTDHLAQLPASVVERGADTDSTVGAP